MTLAACFHGQVHLAIVELLGSGVEFPDVISGEEDGRLTAQLDFASSRQDVVG